MKINSLYINPSDNVAMVTIELAAGQKACFRDGDGEASVTLKGDVPIYHKFCIKDIAKGEHVIKYGESLGIALSDISVGDYVHTHNLQSERENID
ncbi:UxaA family hydrolase [Pseudodesulfovibrio thermohalotolerans]|uniref:UxaA family hydrolase n=1 Tax=Pseudodesulfovibrio thermohalotolerans TaxID=2880651 RepID=UPI002442D09A|nr:UxaA family hydrolase [Pseudodesulfovibrio thermohalotolerans]WFS62323.1 UxaA family hydrolase [Pseudodesulfovibrio thermohalotolerans]